MKTLSIILNYSDNNNKSKQEENKQQKIGRINNEPFIECQLKSISIRRVIWFCHYYNNYYDCGVVVVIFVFVDKRK